MKNAAPFMFIMLLIVAAVTIVNVYQAGVIHDQRMLMQQMVQNPACMSPAPPPAPSPVPEQPKYDPNNEPIERRTNVV